MIPYILFLIINASILFFGINIFGKSTSELGDLNFKYTRFSFRGEEKSLGNNVLLKIIVPNIYVIVIASIFNKDVVVFNEKLLFLVIPAYFIFRITYMCIILNQFKLINFYYEIVVALASCVLGYFICFRFIKDSNEIIVSLTDLKNEIWLLIILFIYDLFKQNVIKKISEFKIYPQSKKDSYIIEKYKKFTKQYNKLIDNKLVHDFESSLIYAIMILENFNRPYIYRCLENILYGFSNKEMTLGIMQIKSKEYLTVKNI